MLFTDTSKELSSIKDKKSNLSNFLVNTGFKPDDVNNIIYYYEWRLENDVHHLKNPNEVNSELSKFQAEYAEDLNKQTDLLFKQKRNGLNYHEFECYKFRSMTINEIADSIAKLADPETFNKKYNFK